MSLTFNGAYPPLSSVAVTTATRNSTTATTRILRPPRASGFVFHFGSPLPAASLLALEIAIPCGVSLIPTSDSKFPWMNRSPTNTINQIRSEMIDPIPAIHTMTFATLASMARTSRV